MNELIDLLNELASYNANEAGQSSSTPDEAILEEYRIKIRELMERIGESSLPPAVVKAFASGKLLRERSSRYIDLMQAWRAIQALRPPVASSHRNDRS